jgi:hypothetical protein
LVGVVSRIAKGGGGVGVIYLPFLTFNVIEAMFYIPLMTQNMKETTYNAANSRLIAISKQFDRLNSYIYRVEGGKDLSEQERALANKIVDSIGIAVKSYKDLIESDKDVLTDIGFYDFTVSMVAVLDEQLSTTKIKLGLTPLWEDLPEVITISPVQVVDGDTIKEYNGKEIRFVGIDAHELGTAAGDVEYQWLNSRIGGKAVDIKIFEWDKGDKFGRILGVPFHNGSNICHEMLQKFGPSILTPTKYQDRHKFVDWDENKLIAEAMESPVSEPLAEPVREDVGHLKISSSPSNAKIYLDGEDTDRRTAETIENLPARVWDVLLQLEDYEVSQTPVLIEKGKTVEVFKKLIKKPAPSKPAKPSRSTLETHFKGAIISEDEARSGLTDLGYSATEVDNFISEWISELKLWQIGEMYKKGMADSTRVNTYMLSQGYTPADVDGSIQTWDNQLAEEAQAATVGNIRITSDPEFADIYLDDVYQRRVTPSLIRGLQPGTYTVKCTAYQHQDAEQTVNVLAGQEVPVHLTLTPSP